MTLKITKTVDLDFTNNQIANKKNHFFKLKRNGSTKCELLLGLKSLLYRLNRLSMNATLKVTMSPHLSVPVLTPLIWGVKLY